MFAFAVCFVLLQGIGVFGEEHDVTVITDPPSGPFLIRNRINFTCHVYPMLSEPVTYSWHAVKDAYGPTTLSGQRTVHYTPYEEDLHFSWFFCKVFSNESLVGVGRRQVEIHGFVFSVESLFRVFIIGDTINLRVNISEIYAARRIRTLIWYHNETEVQASNRITVLNNGREISIQNALYADTGSYRVTTGSVDFGPEEYPVCDSVWLSLLRNHAAFAPVTFTLIKLETNIKKSPSCTDYCTDYSSYSGKLPLQYYPFITGSLNPLPTIKFYHEHTYNDWTYNFTSDIITSNSVSSTLSSNGSTLTLSESKFNWSLKVTYPNRLIQSINFHYNISNEGFYIQQLYINSAASIYFILRNQGFRCINHYFYARDVNLFSVSFVTLPFILTSYQPPIPIFISNISRENTSLVQLDCMALGGVPDSHNITLLHSNQTVLTATVGNRLQLYIANSLFGEFTCIVESIYSTEHISLLLQEKASFQFLLAENKKMACIQWKKVNSDYYEDIKTLFNKICDCSVALEHITADCSRTGSMLLSGTVIYSNSDGNITATTLVDMLQVWILTSTDPVIMLQNQSIKLIIQCPIRPTPTTADACSNLKVVLVTTESAVIGGSFIGGVLTGIFASLATLCIGLCVLKLKADMNMKNARSTSETSQTLREEEVVMGTNQAYETVEMRYQSASRNQQPALSPQENTSPEPVYENQQYL